MTLLMNHLQYRSCFALAVLVLCLFSPASLGKLLVLDKDVEHYALEDHAELLIDPAAELELSDVISGDHDDRFEPMNGRVAGLGFTRAVAWTRVILRNPEATPVRRNLLLDNPRLQEVDLFLLEDGKLLQHREAGTRFTFYRREVNFHSPVFRLELPANSELAVYIRTYSETSHFLPLSLKSDTDMYSRITREYSFEGFVFGILIVLLLYNISLIFVVDEKSYLYYTLYISSGILYQAAISGFGYQFLWSGNPWFAHVTGNTFGILSVFLAMIFAKKFLRSPDTMPRVNLFLNALIGCLLAFLLSSFFLDYRLLSRMLLFVGLIYPLILTVVGILALMHGDSSAKYFVMAFMMICISVGTFVMRLLGVLPDNLLTSNSLSIGIGLEFVFLNLGIAHRINLMREQQEKSLDERIRSAEMVTRASRATERFIPVPALELLGVEDIRGIRLGEQIDSRMTILFADIHTLTATNNTLASDENVEFINQCFSMLEPVVKENHGFICRYIGDSMLCLFPGSADDAVRAGVDIINELYLFAEAYGGLAGRKLEISIGIHTGYMRLGTVGEPGRMEIAVLGDSANLAARVQSVCGDYHVPLLITGETLRALHEEQGFDVRLIGTIQPKGRLESVSIYEVFNTNDSVSRDRKRKNRNLFEEAVIAYRDGRMDDARQKMEAVVADNPTDRVARRYLTGFLNTAERPSLHGLKDDSGDVS